MKCITGEKSDSVIIESNGDDLNSMHLTGRSRARTLTRTYSNVSASAKELSLTELNDKKPGQFILFHRLLL